MAFCEGDAHHTAAPRLDAFAAYDGIERPIGTFDQHVGLQPIDDLLRIVFVKHDNHIDACESGDHLGPFVFRVNRAGRSFDSAHRSVGVNTNDERVPLAPRILQVTDVTWMQEIKHTVGEHDFFPGVAQVLHECDGFRDG